MKIRRYRLTLRKLPLDHYCGEEQTTLKIVPVSCKHGNWVRFSELEVMMNDIIEKDNGIHIDDEPKEGKPWIYWEKLSKFFDSDYHFLRRKKNKKRKKQK